MLNDEHWPRDGSVEESRLLWEGAVRRQRLSEAFIEKYKRLNANESAAVDLAAISEAGKSVAGKQVEPLVDQERLLPAANVGRLMSRQLENCMKLSKETRSFMQEVLSEFICFLTSEVTSRGSRIVTGHEYCIASERLDLGPIGRVCSVMRPRLMPPSRKRKKEGGPDAADAAIVSGSPATEYRRPPRHPRQEELTDPVTCSPVNSCGTSCIIHRSDLSANVAAVPSLTLCATSMSATPTHASSASSFANLPATIRFDPVERCNTAALDCHVSLDMSRFSNQLDKRLSLRKSSKLDSLLSDRDCDEEPSRLCDNEGTSGSTAQDKSDDVDGQYPTCASSVTADGISLEMLIQGLGDGAHLEFDGFRDGSNKVACKQPLALSSAQGSRAVLSARTASPRITSMNDTFVGEDVCCQRASNPLLIKSSSAQTQVEAQMAAMLAVAQAAHATKAARDNLQRTNSICNL